MPPLLARAVATPVELSGTTNALQQDASAVIVKPPGMVSHSAISATRWQVPATAPRTSD